jgi:hypothetical protein
MIVAVLGGRFACYREALYPASRNAALHLGLPESPHGRATLRRCADSGNKP